MEDAGIAVLEALAVWNHSMQKCVIEGEGGNGSQEPTVPWDGRDPIRTALHICSRGSMDAHFWETLGFPGRHVPQQRDPT